MQLPEIISSLKAYSSPSRPLYLVGGAVRDSLLSRPCSDFDFVCHANSEQIARNFANEHNGAFYVLDAERETYRVLVKSSSSSKIMVDFAAMRGEDILEDLSRRDFTINAMAVDLQASEVVIDPLKGGRDLQQKWLRPVSLSSFTDDPLRTIRAIRYAVGLGLRIEPKTSGLIDEAVPGLLNVSAERKRDELFKILSGKRVSASLQLLQRFGVFRFIPLQITSSFEAILPQVRALEELVNWLCGEKTHENQAAFYQASLLLEMGRFTEDFRQLYLTKNNSDRDRKAILQLTAIIDHGEGLEGRLKAIALSVDEIRHICTYKALSQTKSSTFQRDTVITSIGIHRFFKTAGSAGIDLVVTTLADYCAKIGSDFSQEVWLPLLELCGTLVDAWFTRPELINPTPLLNGDEIITEFNLEEGPLIGKLLEQLKEKQVEGVINTVSEASLWIKKELGD